MSSYLCALIRLSKAVIELSAVQLSYEGLTDKEAGLCEYQTVNSTLVLLHLQLSFCQRQAATSIFVDSAYSLGQASELTHEKVQLKKTVEKVLELTQTDSVSNSIFVKQTISNLRSLIYAYHE